MPIIFAQFNSEIVDRLLHLYTKSQKEFGLSVDFIKAYNSLPPPFTSSCDDFYINFHQFDNLVQWTFRLYTNTSRDAPSTTIMLIGIDIAIIQCAYSYNASRSNLLLLPIRISTKQCHFDCDKRKKTRRKKLSTMEINAYSLLLLQSYLLFDINFHCTFRINRKHSVVVASTFLFVLYLHAYKFCLKDLYKYILLKVVWIPVSNQLSHVKW